MFVFQTSGRAANLLKEVFQNTNDEAFNCLNTNYYGCKRVTEALLPLLKLSTSGGARIVNASSLASELKVWSSCIPARTEKISMLLTLIILLPENAK
jgi:(+)-neomenthol dehydrogenase